jgi:2-methylfumaryl-CoA hydratase
MTVEEADHMSATRLYQNNSRPHFDAMAVRESQVGRRLVYGGHVISICRALSYDGLENVVCLLAINGGRHVAPTVAGDTLYAYSRIIDKWKLPARSDAGAVRVRLIGMKNSHPNTIAATQSTSDDGGYRPDVVLDLDYTALMPRKHSAAH